MLREIVASVWIGIIVGCASINALSQDRIVTDTVHYRSGEETVSGYLARPKGEGPFPAIVVIHEWWGLVDWIKENARRLAERGYVALAVDLYRGKIADTPELAHELSRGLPNDRALRDLKAAVAYLRQQKFVDPKSIGVIGWCMGGGYALQLALNEDLKTCIVCYGRVVTNAEDLKSIKSAVLGIFGDQDRGIPVEVVKAFEKALQTQGVTYLIRIYEGVGHAFMNPNNKRGYNEQIAQKAWQEIFAFLDKHLKGTGR
ncbi:MAG: dienelactone hydrolase family protein [Armatimonadetes bacterium]|nr:dienelactone hydrolase family protein [Armatimonadota bacterium]MDW8027855.1 dienelactone hydrolase family protein [Armatimonadota bacterium]